MNYFTLIGPRSPAKAKNFNFAFLGRTSIAIKQLNSIGGLNTNKTIRIDCHVLYLCCNTGNYHDKKIIHVNRLVNDIVIDNNLFVF